MKRLLIDMERVIGCRDFGALVQCEYLYHRQNEGELALLEFAEFAVYCRQCQEAFCVKACPKEALEKQGNGTIKRYNMRCVGCQSCTLACPFGTILPSVMNYISPKCDFCLNRLREDGSFTPLCVKPAPDGTLQLVEEDRGIQEGKEFAIDDYLVVKVPNWRFKESRA